MFTDWLDIKPVVQLTSILYNIFSFTDVHNYNSLHAVTLGEKLTTYRVCIQ